MSRQSVGIRHLAGELSGAMDAALTVTNFRLSIARCLTPGGRVRFGNLALFAAGCSLCKCGGLGTTRSFYSLRTGDT